jgi:multidrug efflux pump subunit AcrA (membrane-fusion protein)
VQVQVDEVDVIEVEVGQPAMVLVDAYPQAELVGRVAYIAVAPERGATGGRTFPVTVELVEVPDEVALRVGLTASAEIEVRRVEADVVVPTSALLRRGEDEVVYAVRDGVAVRVPVEVLAIGEDTAAVDGALRAGEQVVTVGVELIDDGDEIQE